MSKGRRLSGLERAWLTAARVEPPFSFAMVVEGRAGPDGLSEAAWTAAIRRAAAENPGARLRLRGVLGWSRWQVGDRLPSLRTVATTWDASSPEGAEFLTRPMDARSGDTVEVILIPGRDGDRDRVVIRTLHAIMDGRGGQLFGEDLFAALNGRAPTGSVAGPHTDEALAVEAGGKPGAAPTRRWASPLGPVSAATAGLTWRRVHLDGGFRSLLPRTIAALWTASRRHTDGPLRLEIPVDLRRHTPGLRATANLSGIFAVTLTEAPDVQRLSAELREAVSERSYCGAPLRAGVARWLPLSLLAHGARAGIQQGRERNQYEVSATVSNMGRLDLANLSGPAFTAERAFFIPPGNQGLPLLMVLTGHNNGLEICASGPLSTCGEGRLDALLADMTAQLRTA